MRALALSMNAVSKVNDYDIHLNDLYERSAGKLLMTELYDEEAFISLYEYLASKAELLKSEHMISKQIVSTILKASASIRNTSGHVQLSRKNIDLADRFEFLLSLIASNDVPSNRTPNVPHTI